MASDLGFGFDVAPAEALKFFRAKGLETTFSWEDMYRDEHDTAFTVAKMLDLDLLRDVKDAVDKAISEGRTLGDFQKDLEPKLQKAGWWGQKEMTDPLTGETQVVQLGSPRRLETIFRTNLQTAYAAGSWAQITENVADAPYLMYQAVDDERTRPEHHAWSGTILRADDDWWADHTPPCGYNCRCSVIQLDDSDLKRYGLAVAPEAPPSPTREVLNSRSGEVEDVPVGVDPGWGYNPSEASPAAKAAQVLAAHIASTDADLGANAWDQVAEVAAPGLKEAFGQFVRDVMQRNQPTRAMAIAGIASREDIDFLNSESITPVSSEIAIEDRLIVGAKAGKHAEAGNALTAEEWLAVPDGFAKPEVVLFDRVKRNLLYVWPSLTDPRKIKVAVEPNFNVSKPKATLNLARTAFKMNAKILNDRRRYVVVRGDLK
jgi:SPP1 gp7 family putative phage head morphogenesis protein